MATIEDRLVAHLRTLPPKPTEDATSNEKRYYGQQMSNALAFAFANELHFEG